MRGKKIYDPGGENKEVEPEERLLPIQSLGSSE